MYATFYVKHYVLQNEDRGLDFGQTRQQLYIYINGNLIKEKYFLAQGKGQNRNSEYCEMAFIKTTIMCNYSLTGCCAVVNPPKNVVEVKCSHLESTQAIK